MRGRGLISHLHDPVTWYKITHTGEQVAQWDSKTKQPVHLDLPLFWKSHCAICSSACVILYLHVTGSCKEPIGHAKLGTCPKKKASSEHSPNGLEHFEVFDNKNRTLLAEYTIPSVF